MNSSKYICEHVLPRFPVWKILFVRRWQALNYALHLDDDTTLEIDTTLKRAFPRHVLQYNRDVIARDWTESRMYQFLTHSITLNVEPQRVVNFAFSVDTLGGDRSVRANVPFPVVPRVVVFKCRVSSNKCVYRASIVSSSYFEISITDGAKHQRARIYGSDMVSIGVATSQFRLLETQPGSHIRPGWDRNSFGYHGDDGKLFKRHGRFEVLTPNGPDHSFGPSFGVGDTVGCGVRRRQKDQRSFVYFTNNGNLVPDPGLECPHLAWYPVIGLDCPDVVHVNFGQECVQYHAIMATQSRRHAASTPLLNCPRRMDAAFPSWSDLPDELLAVVLSCLSPRDVEAATIASKHVHERVLPRFPVWKMLFARRWQALNYALHLDDDTTLEIDTKLKQAFPRSWTESRMYQFLTHTITPVPSFADLRSMTKKSGFESGDHSDDAVQPWPASLEPRRVVNFTFAGNTLGGDRSVRTNVPFPLAPRVGVFKSRVSTNKFAYRVSIVSSSYFEISIIKGAKRQRARVNGSDMASVGIATSQFKLLETQPGWDRNSFGYHRDDGNLFHHHGRGHPFGPPFGVGDTVGCGVRRSSADQRSFVYFTNNGDVIPDTDMECAHVAWFPVVGLDCADVVQMNFGQELFQYIDVVVLKESKDVMAMMGTDVVAAPWLDLQDELLASVLGYLLPRDVEAAAIAWKDIHERVLPRFPIWKNLFVLRWEMLNYALDLSDGTALEIDSALKQAFPSDWSESRMFQFLTHAITPVPSFADLRKTCYKRGYASSEHNIQPWPAADQTRRVVNFTYAGNVLGGDRSVRSNVPFPVVPRVAVFKCRVSGGKCVYRVSVVSSGYFEFSIAKGVRQQRIRRFGSDMASIGIGTSKFRLVDKQPGWDRNSYGYHGDDGNLFHRHGRGHPFGPSFGVGDTVGCGVRRGMAEQRSTACKEVLLDPDRNCVDADVECSHEAWYPIVGLDCADVIHMNFGQEPFRYDDVVDNLMAEASLLPPDFTSRMQWYSITDSDAEEDWDANESDDDSRNDAGPGVMPFIEWLRQHGYDYEVLANGALEDAGLEIVDFDRSSDEDYEMLSEDEVEDEAEM
ncbi:TPA: hypothetical protein N0F65_001824 [Lagenidium giganteum]|uniref:F-box domain-containing protein n=1 Tax=Lagenidium giganteum TaxID=4803 RepID=A0AAV2Z7E0_9STRA|nr:TPA: hypothetical protein N0F65_001824 [Lagenidium giganteum]